ncbi:MAG: hypothetical protein A2Y54_05995 [Chloroflexi bacterium RBG_16_51_16]|nr:MAG: hypothetical protein A2Y54_05995 [Chloroflexi bacterium RBG_16_51_16]
MTNGRLQDKVVILTGGTSGIGLAIVRLFCNEGAKVAIGARNEKVGNELVKDIRKSGRGEAFYVKTDVTHPEQVENLVKQTVEHFGKVDVLVANSGVLILESILELSLEEWERTIATNLSGQFYLAKYGIPAMIKSDGKGKAVIFVGSELGTVGTTGGAAYCASKGGIINMTRAVAIDCASYGIRVNCLAPGPIDTPMLQSEFTQAKDGEAVKQAQLQPLLIKRFGTAEEMAEVALFLATVSSSYMTGALVVADGGATTWYGM